MRYLQLMILITIIISPICIEAKPIFLADEKFDELLNKNLSIFDFGIIKLNEEIEKIQTISLDKFANKTGWSYVIAKYEKSENKIVISFGEISSNKISEESLVGLRKICEKNINIIKKALAPSGPGALYAKLLYPIFDELNEFDILELIEKINSNAIIEGSYISGKECENCVNTFGCKSNFNQPKIYFKNL